MFMGQKLVGLLYLQRTDMDYWLLNTKLDLETFLQKHCFDLIYLTGTLLLFLGATLNNFTSLLKWNDAFMLHTSPHCTEMRLTVKLEQLWSVPPLLGGSEM